LLDGIVFFYDLICWISLFDISSVVLLDCAMVDDGWRLERGGGLDMNYGRKD
jgi:hypothetical protein